METQKQLISRDAVNRAVRTLWTGVGIDVLVAVALVIGTTVATADGWGAIEWALVSYSVFKSAVQAIVSYIARRYVDTSRRLQESSIIPTPPLPPAVSGE